MVEIGGYPVGDLVRLLKLMYVYREDWPIIDLGGRRLAILGDVHGYPEVVEKFLNDYWRGLGVAVFLGNLGNLGRDSFGVWRIILERAAETFKRLEEMGYDVEAVAKEEVEPSEEMLNDFFEDFRILVIRGGFEAPGVSWHNGFFNQLMEIAGKPLIKEFIDLFTYLPVGAVHKSKVFLVHGGIPCHVTSLNDIKFFVIRSPIDEKVDPPLNSVIGQLLWNTPVIHNIKCSSDYTGGNYFGLKVFERFMWENDMKAIVRSRNYLEGYGVLRFGGSFFSGRRDYKERIKYNSAYTIYSSPHKAKYLGVAEISGDIIKLSRFTLGEDV